MKRTWTIFALLFAGSIYFSNLQATSNTSSTAIEAYQFNDLSLTEQEEHILEIAAPKLGLVYSELVMLYETGDATITALGGGSYRVSAYVNDGTNPIIAVIDSAL
jgi:hypothetical protein